jgi:hypothetical protein
MRNLIKRSFSTGKNFIRNENLPVCANCIHFIEEKTNYPYDPPPNYLLGQCKKFGEVNFITGVIKYDYATICREDIRKCGHQGLEYEANLDVK